jgi:bacterioferritin
LSEKNEDMLWYDLYAEDDTVKAYRERIKQAQAMEEYALAEILQELVREEQDHQIDLATALGVIADDRQRQGEGPGRPKS